MVEQPVLITPEIEASLPFQPCRKKFMTARPITQEEFELLGGQLGTNEGVRKLLPDDYIGKDMAGGHRNFWPIRRAKIEDPAQFRQISAPNAAGWANYEPIGDREACQITDYPFSVNDFIGQQRYYLVRNKGEFGKCWIVADNVFDQDYYWL